VRVSEGVLRVVQLNVDSLVGSGWSKRRNEIVTWLDELDADIVCLQEVWQDNTHPNTAGQIAEHAAGNWYWEFGGFAPPDPGAVGADPSLRFGSAILSRWPFDEVEVMSLPVVRDEQDPAHVTMRPPALPRGMPFELLHGRTAGVDVYTHLQPLPGQAAHRVRQVLFIDDAVARTCDPAASMPPILCGDFNARPGSDEIRFLTASAVIDGRSTYFEDAWSAVNEDSGMTQDLANDLYLAFNEPPKRIDHVFVGDACLRPNAAGRVLRASLAFNTRKTETFASDHYGLSVDITWPARPSTPYAELPA
jgi:endonuclease/exonuclease/phosphatase family metal-dependent hydrolase